MTALEEPPSQPMTMKKDTRRDPRAKVLSMTVRYKSATVAEFIENHSYDISRGGMFIKTTSPFPAGTLLKFEVRIAEEQKLMMGVGRVIWRREPGKANKTPAGMGVKFIKIGKDSVGIIQRLVESRSHEVSSFEEGAADQGIQLSSPPEALRPREEEQAGPVSEESDDRPTPFFPMPGDAPPAADQSMLMQSSELLKAALQPSESERVERSSDGPEISATSVPPEDSPSAPPQQEARKTLPTGETGEFQLDNKETGSEPASETKPEKPEASEPDSPKPAPVEDESSKAEPSKPESEPTESSKPESEPTESSKPESEPTEPTSSKSSDAIDTDDSKPEPTEPSSTDGDRPAASGSNGEAKPSKSKRAKKKNPKKKKKKFKYSNIPTGKEEVQNDSEPPASPEAVTTPPKRDAANEPSTSEEGGSGLRWLGLLFLLATVGAGLYLLNKPESAEPVKEPVARPADPPSLAKPTKEPQAEPALPAPSTPTPEPSASATAVAEPSAAPEPSSAPSAKPKPKPKRRPWRRPTPKKTTPPKAPTVSGPATPAVPKKPAPVPLEPAPKTPTPPVPKPVVPKPVAPPVPQPAAPQPVTPKPAAPAGQPVKPATPAPVAPASPAP